MNDTDIEPVIQSPLPANDSGVQVGDYLLSVFGAPIEGYQAGWSTEWAGVASIHVIEWLGPMGPYLVAKMTPQTSADVPVCEFMPLHMAQTVKAANL